jgi:hypothetical protein
VGFGISGVETSGSAATEIVIYRFGVGRWMEMAHDRVKWRAVVLNVFNLRILLPRLYDPPAAVFIAVYQVQVRPNGFSWTGLSSYTITVNKVDRRQRTVFIFKVTNLYCQDKQQRS